ncbi:MAG: ketoacyl-ACP synthase III [Actinobacteria bacterium]|nr:ketoacyl-ACP synthase III [Actinomycetota bacterium]
MAKILKPVGIAGIGSYVPEKVLTNSSLEEMVDTSDEWIRTRTGIIERRIVSEDENTSDLAVEAAKKAIKDAGISEDEIDLVVVATASPDLIWPSTACIVQNKLKIKNCGAFDISAVCTGFVYGLAVASQFVATGMYKNVLLIGAESISRFIDWKDRNTCVLFGDGAGAVVLQEATEGFGVLKNYLGADGKRIDILKIPAGGSAIPSSYESVEKKLHYIHMNGNEVYKFAITALVKSVKKVLSSSGFSLDEVNYIIPHQANQRITEAASARLKIDRNKIISNIDKYGNTSSASIPIALDEIYQSGKIKYGDLVITVGFGAGLTWGANLIRWNK